MVDIKVFGVNHINVGSTKVSEEIQDSIDDKTLVFLEPTENGLRLPERIVTYQRGFWTDIRNLALSKGAYVVPISHEDFPRLTNPYGEYFGLSTGIAEPRIGVAVLLEEELQTKWVDSLVSDSEYKGVVIIGKNHAERLTNGLVGKGNETLCTSLCDFDPQERFYSEITNLIEQKGDAKCVRITWLDRVKREIIAKTFGTDEPLIVDENNDYNSYFDLVLMDKRWAARYQQAKKELLKRGMLEPLEGEELLPGCVNETIINTYRVFIEKMYINSLRSYMPPILSKKDFT
jgi:hypothetical protein